MNVYVMVDIEGISGVYARDQVLTDGARFSEGRRYITEDINTVIRGLKDAGVDKIYVRDCHGGSNSVIWDQLSPDADYYVCGMAGDVRFPGIEDCDAVILLGYHAMAGARHAVLEHSWNSREIQNIYINDEKVGEIAIDAAIVGEYGKPVIMLSGDDKACDEAKKFLPDVVCAEVKKSLGSFGSMLLPKQKAHALLYEKTVEAVKNFNNIKTFSFAEPIKCRVEVTERTQIPLESKCPYLKVIDGRTYEVEGETVEQLVFRMLP